MLCLKNITKDYVMGGSEVHALKGISIDFRENEFVSILGQSGCGKTTMLNIIGGLDRYTDGDLVIDGVSTKKYKDRDWDTYRNHKIGFVFQSYNLIPHQTVLSNVELALTLSGVSKAERRKRAVEVLERVGLGDQLKKSRIRCRADKCSASPSREHSSTIPIFCSPTSRRARSTAKQAFRLWKSSARSRKTS